MAKAQKGQSAKAAAKKRIVKVDSYGDAHIVASFNNIIISLTNKNGQVISWSSAGKMGFKGSKKNTPYAAQTAAQECATKAFELGQSAFSESLGPTDDRLTFEAVSGQAIHHWRVLTRHGAAWTPSEPSTFEGATCIVDG